MLIIMQFPHTPQNIHSSGLAPRDDLLFGNGQPILLSMGKSVKQFNEAIQALGLNLEHLNPSAKQAFQSLAVHLDRSSKVQLNMETFSDFVHELESMQDIKKIRELEQEMAQARLATYSGKERELRLLKIQKKKVLRKISELQLNIEQLRLQLINEWRTITCNQVAVLEGTQMILIREITGWAKQSKDESVQIEARELLLRINHSIDQGPLQKRYTNVTLENRSLLHRLIEEKLDAILKLDQVINQRLETLQATMSDFISLQNSRQSNSQTA